VTSPYPRERQDLWGSRHRGLGDPAELSLPARGHPRDPDAPDDRLRNHGFLWTGRGGWILSPAYDINPTPADVRQRILSTNISLDEATCDLGLVRSVAEYFSLAPAKADTIIRQVATTTAKWPAVAADYNARSSEIHRMESAFEHSDLAKALAL